MQKYLIIAVVVLIGSVTAMGFWIESLYTDIAVEKSNTKSALEAKKQCENDKEKSNALAEILTKDLADADRAYADFRLRTIGTLCKVKTKPTATSDGATVEPELSGGVEVSAERIFELSTRCQKDAVKLKTLQDYIRGYNE